MFSLKEGKIIIDNKVSLNYADKCTIKKDKSTNTRNTLGGTINTSAFTTGGSCSIESLILPETVQEVNELYNVLEEDNIQSIVVTGKAYLKNGTEYTMTFNLSRCAVNADEIELNPEDGIVGKFEFNFDNMKRVNQ